MKYGIVFCMLFLLLTASLREVQADAVADSYDPISNDITYVPADESGKGKGIVVVRLSSYTVGTSGVYLYNDGGGTSTSAGAIKTRGKVNRNIQINITNMKEAGTNTVSIEVANGTTTPTLWATVVEINYIGTSTAGFPMSEGHDYTRIGVKRSGDNSADFTIKESYTE